MFRQHRLPQVTALKWITCAFVWLCLAATATGCSGTPPHANSVRQSLSPEYDRTGKLRLLRYDSNGDGKIDMWSYMEGARIVRIELDTDFNGAVDRWEYYTADRTLEKVGFSRGLDGVQDAWSYADGSGAITRIEVSTHRDGAISRIEHYERGQMVRAEEDADGVAGMDKWESYNDGRLTSLAFDTLGRGAPSSRLTYGADGTAQLEVDPEGDGTFVAQ
jgi:hypothetical protein